MKLNTLRFCNDSVLERYFRATKNSFAERQLDVELLLTKARNITYKYVAVAPRHHIKHFVL